MKPKKSQPPPRKLRTDAQQNRARLLEVAKLAFTRHGASASLDEIAREAGVGAGTLYRHFPTRDALIEAVYRTEVECVAAAAPRFAETMPPLAALRAWMLLLIDHIDAKHIIAPVLNSLVGGPSRLYESSRAPMLQAIELLVHRAIVNGDLRPDVQAPDLLVAIIGFSNIASSTPDWKQSARRLVDTLIAGSQP